MVPGALPVVLETGRMSREAREALSLAVCERAPWSVKCSVVGAVANPGLRHLTNGRGVSDGTRTRDRRDHNPELYQLSYAHQARRRV